MGLVDDRTASNPFSQAAAGDRGLRRKDAARALCAAGKALAGGVVARATGGRARHHRRARGAGQNARAADSALARCARRRPFRRDDTEMVGIEVISATERLPANSTGELMGGMQAVFARFYSAQLSERVALGLETKAKKGYWPTYAPSGYVNDRLTNGISPDPVSAPLDSRALRAVRKHRCRIGRRDLMGSRAWAAIALRSGSCS